MDISSWQQILISLKVIGKVRPSREEDLDAYEAQHNFLLPTSYRTYCLVFGPGILTDWYTLAVPGYDGRYQFNYNLEAKTKFYHDDFQGKDYTPNPEQFARAVIFGDDVNGVIYFWDTAEPTDRQNHECAIYALFRDHTLERLADSFSGFVDICLHRTAKKLYKDSPEMVFRAAVGWKRQVKKK